MYSMYFNKLTMAGVMKPHISHEDWIGISKSLLGHKKELVTLTVAVFRIYFTCASSIIHLLYHIDTKTMRRTDNKNEKGAALFLNGYLHC